MSTGPYSKDCKLMQKIGWAVRQQPVYCSGVIPVPDDLMLLYFGKGESTRRVDLGDASLADLEALSNACEPAAFGLGDQTVMDETYRKAGKLDCDAFATLFHPGDVGIREIVHNELLGGEKDFTMELYKLNVYGKDAFFKPHQDTPRSEKMFGSLVIVFPTAHEGGEFVLHEKISSRIIDFSEILLSSKAPVSFVGYIAFFSDTSHEVRPVKSGHRVTLTYNLYFTDAPEQNTKPSHTFPSSIQGFLTKYLRKLTSALGVLPNGGYLVFGLRHKYALKASQKADTLREYLKGSDDILARACDELKLDWAPHVYYQKLVDNMSFVFSDRVIKYDYVEDHELSGPGADAETFVSEWSTVSAAEDGSLSSTLHPRRWEEYQRKLYPSPSDRETKGVLWRSYQQHGDRKWHGDTVWVTGPMSDHKIQTHHTAYGNESTVEYLYGCVCLLVKLKPSAERGDAVAVGGEGETVAETSAQATTITHPEVMVVDAPSA
ncbi:hypothetical protein CONPUDRAFT_135362 [Coniophora puteana RWD-64-598 SS2]|uniref:Fe2OG dioxygenase domain-containing protein n=1 Tax=Coniophora puteana (strain RWD-64-598) TaxID=741705 RepID=A0A5M3N4P9_CONPW|nr:uncharacterized protein CONPUDRAFT_135362 [Coniophora puteana RWD-64-598 SS2]EIW85815.1 hypothetical protein CONPUDRAFT_135362 [Coniophora puteana RWD-64-598 SS2]